MASTASSAGSFAITICSGVSGTSAKSHSLARGLPQASNHPPHVVELLGFQTRTVTGIPALSTLSAFNCAALVRSGRQTIVSELIGPTGSSHALMRASFGSQR